VCAQNSRLLKLPPEYFLRNIQPDVLGVGGNPKQNTEAERRAGELLRDMEKQDGGDAMRARLHHATEVPPRLVDIGIDKWQSHRWWLEASVPEELYRPWLAETRAERKELTSIELIRGDCLASKGSGMGIPQERIAARLGITQDVVSDHLRKSLELKNGVNSQLKCGFGVNTIAEKLGWPEPLVWAVALEGKTDKERFEALKWNIRPWDYWNWGDVDHRFGAPYEGRIPGKL